MKQFGRPAKNSIFQNIYEQPYNDRIKLKLYNSAKGNADFVQRLGLQRSLAVHRGCVNCICWSDDGRLLLSGSDDQHLVVSHAYNFKTLTDYKTSHRANIFSAKFLPSSGDTNIVSCSGDGIILFTDLMRTAETRNNQFNCHKGTTYEVATVPNEPHTFLSCGEDYTVRCFDLRIKEKCDKDNCSEDVLISCQRAVTALTINSVRPYQMAIGCSDSTVRMFDRRMIGTKASGFSPSPKGPRPFASFTAPGMEDRSYRITSLGFSPQGEDVLVSYSSEHLYLFSIKEDKSVELEPTVGGWEEEGEEEEDGEGSDSKPSGLPPVRRLRLRGDWSDTGPDARPERDGANGSDTAQARPTLHATLMQRMTDVLSRMLNDPATRAALSHGGEDDHHQHYVAQPAPSNAPTDDPGREEAEDPANAGNPEEFPVVAVSIDGIYADSNSPTEPEPVDSSSWAAGGTNQPPEPAVALPSFQSSFAGVNLTPTPSGINQTPAPSGLNQTTDPAVVDATPTPAEVSTTPAPSEGQPSTSTTSLESASEAAASSSLTNLTDQISSLRHGFIERHGTEPVVNLTYSDKGSTTSRISLSMADEVSREAVLPTDSAGPSTQTTPSPPLHPIDPMSENDDDLLPDSDNELTELGPARGEQCSAAERGRNYSDEIEREMNAAVAAVRKSRSSLSFEDKVKIRRLPVKQKYMGHRNARTMIKEATFWGDGHVLSGSDCGHVFAWDRATARLVMLLEADHHVVNCLQPHPFLPILATSGIDYDVKLWAPLLPEPGFNPEMAEELVKRNEVMLEETKDTITVPASFMIRMLACLNQIRRGSRRPRRANSDNAESSQDS